MLESKLMKHLQYINRRKQELEKEDKYSLINKLVIKELELLELETEINKPDEIDEYKHYGGNCI